MASRQLQLLRRSLSISSTVGTDIAGGICRVISDNRGPHHDLESSLSPFTSSVTPSVVEHVLRRCRNLPSAAHRFFLWSSSLSPPSPTSHSILFDILGAARQFPIIWAHLYDLRDASHASTTVTNHLFHLLFRAYARANLPADAIRALYRMPDFGLTPSDDDIHQLILALCRRKHVSEAQNFFEELLKSKLGFRISLKNYSMLMDGWSLVGQHDRAFKLFDEMIERGVSVDLSAYNSLFSVLCRMGRMDEAYARVREMRNAHGIEPDAATFGVFVRTACDSKDVHECLRLLERVWRHGLVLNVSTYNCIVNFLCNEEKLDEAYKVLDGMVERGVKPDVRTYNGILSSHCKLREVNKAIRLLARMDKDSCLPDRHTYNMLLKMLVSVGRIDRAMEVWNSMEGRGFYPSAPSYSLMIHALCQKKNWIEEACRFFEIMVDEGIPPYANTCELLRDQLLQHGLQERVHVLFDKMQRSTSKTIQDLSSAMEGRKKAGAELKEWMEHR